MKILRLFTFSLVSGLSLTAPAYGQAVIGYGINVGRAGAAGAASGTGAAGVLGALKGTLEKGEKDQTGARQATVSDVRTEEDQDEVAASQAEAKAKTGGQEDSETPHSVRTPSGVVISGLPSRRGASGYGGPAPANNAPAPAVASPAALGNSQANSAAASSTPAASASSRGPLGSGVIEPMVAGAGRPVSGAESLSSELEKNESPEQEETLEELKIPIGAPIAELIKRFGKPLVSLKGIAGREYTEKYVFQTPRGSRITVLSYEGKVTSVVLPEELTAQAAKGSL